MKIIIIIPAYNEARTLPEVIQKIRSLRSAISSIECIVVNDGSRDSTELMARQGGAKVLSHRINRGLGAALSTGIGAALLLLERNGEDGIMVTLDADGQHDPQDIIQLIRPIEDQVADVVIGSRFLKGYSRETVPWHRRMANQWANIATGVLFGVWVTDSQSGLRAFSRRAAQALCLRTNTMEVSSEIIREIKRNRLRYAEVPVTVVYTEYSMSKKGPAGQGFFRGLETLWKLIVLKFFR